VRYSNPLYCFVFKHKNGLSGCCHTDLHAALDDWPVKSKTPLIGGHEGVGIVVAIGDNTVQSPVKLGDRVGIKWLAYSCLMCEHCRKGREQSTHKSLFVSKLLTFAYKISRLFSSSAERIHG
jgi:D-arabinose 1-dehydrogenase-like Zn-dependent alcohol dehydrogenase